MDLLNQKGEKLYDHVTVIVPGESPRKFSAKEVVEIYPGCLSVKTPEGGIVMYWNVPTIIERLASNKTEWTPAPPSDL